MNTSFRIRIRLRMNQWVAPSILVCRFESCLGLFYGRVAKLVNATPYVLRLLFKTKERGPRDQGPHNQCSGRWFESGPPRYGFYGVCSAEVTQQDRVTAYKTKMWIKWIQLWALLSTRNLPAYKLTKIFESLQDTAAWGWLSPM